MAYSWDSRFFDLFNLCVQRYAAGDEDFEGYFNPADLGFLASIGHRTREIFDWVEDHVDSGGAEPSLGTALLVASARRDYFLTVQKGKPSSSLLRPDDLPARDSELAGYRWLPRILAKARAKLRGELDPEIMYGCGGDRAFLRPLSIHPADFLRAVWAAGDDDAKLEAWLRSSTSSPPPAGQRA